MTAHDFDPIFLVGAPRSGSRWMLQLLGAHPDVAFGRESYAFEAIEAYWRTVVEREERGQGLLVHGYLDRDGLARICRDLFRASVARVVGEKRWFVDKTPLYTRFVPLLHEVFPEARIVHLIRDGRDVAYSMLAAREEQGKRLPEDVAGCAKRWCEIEPVLRFGRDHPEIYTELRYEEAVEDPVAAVAGLFEWLRIPVPAATLAEIAERTRQPFHPSKASEGLGYVGKWRKLFDADDLRRFDAVAGPLLAELGYDAD